MGDRTDVTLTLFGIASRKAVEEIYQAIEQSEGVSAEDCRETFEESDYPLSIEEVNYGEMDDAIYKAIQAAGLGYVWEWSAGGGYGAGLEFLDPRDQTKPASHSTLEQEIALTAKAAEDPETLAAVIADKNKLESLAGVPLCVADSSHEALQILAKHPELKGFGTGSDASQAA